MQNQIIQVFSSNLCSQLNTDYIQQHSNVFWAKLHGIVDGLLVIIYSTVTEFWRARLPRIYIELLVRSSAFAFFSLYI